MESKKPPYLSKTILLNVIIALVGVVVSLGLAPASVSQFVQSNAELLLTILGAFGVGLRLITKGKISLGE
jgi:hypothetical protein